MIRTKLIPNHSDIVLRLPKSFVGKQVEVIAFTVTDALDESDIVDKISSQNASQQMLAKDWSTSEEDKAWENL